MKQMLKTPIILLILAVSIESASAQTARKKPQLDMAKINSHRAQALQKAAEQQSQLKFVPMAPVNMPVPQNKSSDSSAILRNRQGTVKTKEN